MRANRTGVTGLSKLSDGRYRLDLRPPLVPERVTRLYPRDWTLTMVRADARRQTADIVSGRTAAREAEKAQRAALRPIAAMAPEVIAFRKQAGGSPATLSEFTSIVNGRIVPLLGTVAPHELTSERLAGFVDALTTGGCGPIRVRNVVKVLGAFIKIVRVRGLDPLLKTNPLRDAVELGLKVPSPKRTEPVRLALDDARKLVHGAKVPAERRARYALAFLTGLRDGELAALTWDDVAGDVVRVRGAVALVGDGKVGPPKTEAAKRDVPLHDALRPYLAAWRAAWTKAVGRAPTGADPVFASPRRGVEGSLRPY
ncbi:MAG TPA: hypothetical protein VGM56_33230, partial [Byssovorax sp.]